MASTRPSDRLTGNRCHCRQCGGYFTTVRNFDRHLRGRGRPICLDPATVGLVLNAFGYWQLPGAEEPRRFAAGERAERAEWPERMGRP